jgi:predicted Zn-dependent protease
VIGLARASCLALVFLSLGCGTLSVTEEQDLGDRFEREVRREFRFVGDRVINDYVARIGHDVLRTLGPQPFDYAFQVTSTRSRRRAAAST